LFDEWWRECSTKETKRHETSFKYAFSLLYTCTSSWRVSSLKYSLTGFLQLFSILYLKKKRITIKFKTYYVMQISNGNWTRVLTSQHVCKIKQMQIVGTKLWKLFLALSLKILTLYIFVIFLTLLSLVANSTICLVYSIK